MLALDVQPNSLVARINELKAQQQDCTRFLLECITYREKFPQFTNRIDVVIAKIEIKMSHNASQLARLEADLGYTGYTN